MKDSISPTLTAGGPVAVETVRPVTRPPIGNGGERTKTPAPTQFAMRALNLAERFAQICGKEELPGEGVCWHAELVAPEGLSTGGGKQSVQHIKLVPDTGATIVIGHANQVDGRAELRTFECLARIHGRRFHGQQLPLDRASYDAFLERLRQFFDAFHLNVNLIDTPPQVELGSSPPAALAGRRADVAARAVIAVAGLALFLVVLLMLRR